MATPDDVYQSALTAFNAGDSRKALASLNFVLDKDPYNQAVLEAIDQWITLAEENIYNAHHPLAHLARTVMRALLINANGKDKNTHSPAVARLHHLISEIDALENPVADIEDNIHEIRVPDWLMEDIDPSELDVPDWLIEDEGYEEEYRSTNTPLDFEDEDDEEDFRSSSKSNTQHVPPLIPPPAPIPSPITLPEPEQHQNAEPPSFEATEKSPKPAPIRPPSPITRSEQPAKQDADEPIQFSTYYPRDVQPNDWYPLRSYVFRESAADKVEEDFEKDFAGVMDNIRNVLRAARTFIQAGAEITAAPSIPGFRFDPLRVTISLVDDWHSFDFKMRADTAAQDENHKGVIRFTVEGILICEIPLNIYVTTDALAPQIFERITPDPVVRDPFLAVFCSYSRKDVRIVERVERVIKTLGYDYLRDLTTIRTGENWDERLLQMIDKADIFQLFWSSNSSGSPAVRKEWDHALKIAEKRRAFIRPVFWEHPMPAPPSELGHINFLYDPTLDE